jgi:hypothetical protein
MSSEINLQVTPNGVCTLRREDDAAHSLRVYADPEGVIRFHVRPSNEHSEVATVVIDCDLEGKVTRLPLELRSSFKPTRAMPAPPSVDPRPRREGARVRQALDLHEALRLSDEALVERGYPLQPHPSEAPRAFNAWRRAVSIPTTIVEPTAVSRPDISHGAKVVAGPKRRATGAALNCEAEGRTTG